MTVTYDTATLTARQTNEAAKNILSVATHTDGISLEVTAHGYVVGDLVRVAGTTDYNGRYMVIRTPDTTHIVVDDTFTSTQTGTVARGDKDHSAFGALTPVTSTDLSVTDYPYHVYDGSTVTLVVGGDMLLNQFEELVFVGDIRVDGGNYVQGVIRDEPADAGSVFKAPVPLPSLHIVRRGVHPQNDPGFDVLAGGRHEMNGAMMMMHSAYRARYTSATDQASVRFNDAYIYIEGLATQNNVPYKVRFDGTDVQINGLQQYGGAFTTERVLDTFLGYEPTHYEGWQVPTTSDKTAFFTSEGYRGGRRGNIQDVRWTGTKMILKNCFTGPDVVGAGHSPSADGTMGITQAIKPKAVDTDGNPIEGPRYFLRDINNGNRGNYTQNSNNDNYVDDRTYTDAMNAQGEGETVDVLTSVTVANGSNGDGAIRDHRFSNDLLATADIPFWGYGYIYTPVPGLSLIKDSVLEILATMENDLSITGTAHTS